MSSEQSADRESKKNTFHVKEAGEIVLCAAEVAAAVWIGSKMAKVGKVVNEAEHLLPKLEVGTTTESKLLKAAETVLPSDKPVPLGMQLLRGSTRLSVKAARTVLGAMKRGRSDFALASDVPGYIPVDDTMRKHVFDRFLARLDDTRYALHGSYALEKVVPGARKAAKDLDLLALDKSLMKDSKRATTDALVADLHKAAQKDLGDGLQFEVEGITRDPIYRVFPTMRHAIATAKVGDQPIMRFDLDVRLAKTLLPLEKLPIEGGSVSGMQKEENFAYKFFTYTNRNAGGLARKSKDLYDMAAILKSGVDEDKVAEALQSWTSRGYKLGPMLHPSNYVGSRLSREPKLLVGQTHQELNDNFKLLKNFYDRVHDRATSVDLLPDVKTNPLARLRRATKAQLMVDPEWIRH